MNIQPHSGAQATRQYFLLCGQVTQCLACLSHRRAFNTGPAQICLASGLMLFSMEFQETGTIDYDEVRALAEEHKPKMIVAGASAFHGHLILKLSAKLLIPVGAYLMVDMAHISGLVAAGVHPSPVPHAHIVTSTTHKTLRAARGGIILSNDESLSKINSAVFQGLQGGPAACNCRQGCGIW